MNWENLSANSYYAIAIWTISTSTMPIQQALKGMTNQPMWSFQIGYDDSTTKPSLLPYLILVVAIVFGAVIFVRVVSYLAKLRSRSGKKQNSKDLI
jgi:hypothetical protein